MLNTPIESAQECLARIFSINGNQYDGVRLKGCGSSGHWVEYPWMWKRSTNWVCCICFFLAANNWEGPKQVFFSEFPIGKQLTTKSENGVFTENAVQTLLSLFLDCRKICISKIHKRIFWNPQNICRHFFSKSITEKTKTNFCTVAHVLSTFNRR